MTRNRKSMKSAVMLWWLAALFAIASAEEETVDRKLAKEFDVIYSGQDKKANLAKRYSAKVISPQIREKVMAYEKDKRIAIRMAELPEAIEVPVIDFRESLQYENEAVSMNVIQADKSLVEIEHDRERFGNIAVERVIPVRKEDSVTVESINEFSRARRDEPKEDRAEAAQGERGLSPEN